MALHLLAEPTDIEDAATLGRSVQTCSYYATRTALAAAQVVVLPYNMLLSQETRKAIGLHLHGSLVVMDEAHNIPEALRQVHSCCLSNTIIMTALEQMDWYLEKYQHILASRNLYYLGQLRKILMTLQKTLWQMTTMTKKNNNVHNKNQWDATTTTTTRTRTKTTTIPENKMMTGMEVLTALRLDNTNLCKVLRYLKESGLPQKLLGFVNHRKQQQEEQLRQQQQGHDKINNNNNTMVDGPPLLLSSSSSSPELSKHISAMSLVQTMLEKFVLTNGEGKFLFERPKSTQQQQHEQQQQHGSGDDKARQPIVVIAQEEEEETEQQQQQAQLRFVLLKPAVFLENVLQEAHAVAFVGGTLQPFSHVAAELLLVDRIPPGVMACGCVAQQANNAASMTHHQQQQLQGGGGGEPKQWQQQQQQQILQPDSVVPSSSSSFLVAAQQQTPREQKESSSSTTTDTTDTSYSYISSTFTTFSCNHVVSPDNVLLQCWSTGVTGCRFDFRHGSRYNDTQCNELGCTLLEICQVVPCGIVVFVSSYSYESFLVRHWKSTGLWQKLQCQKTIFREPKKSQQIESTLALYTKAATTTTTTEENSNGCLGGAILFSVIGGKMSEGINFSDDMASELFICLFILLVLGGILSKTQEVL